MSASPVENQHTLAKNLGLTKREAFAMAAMQGFCSDRDFWLNSLKMGELGDIARDAVHMADALLSVLEET